MTKVLVPADEEIARARAIRESEKARFGAKSMRYVVSHDAIDLQLHSGVRLQIPRSEIRWLAGVPKAELAQLTTSPQGSAIHLESLDIDISVKGLLMSLAGIDWGAAGRKTSRNKAATSRTNGMRGGSPRKHELTASRR